MAEQDNVETNPILAIGLAGVALIGVLGSFLPPSLVDRMIAPEKTSTSEPLFHETTQQAASVSPEHESAVAGEVSQEPTAEASTIPSEQGPAFPREPSADVSTGDEVATAAGTELAEKAMPATTPALPGEQSPLAETVASAAKSAQEKGQPTQAEARERPRLPPEPVYRQVPPWGHYPPPAYPPVYNPYYPQPPY